MTEPHDELAQRLRRGDPASSLPPAAPEAVARLLEETMGQDLLTETRETGTRSRGPLTWLVAAAAVVVIAGAGLYAVLGTDDVAPPAPTADPPPTVTTLSAPGPAVYSQRCMVPNARVIAQQPVAFDGVVDSIDGDTVTLSPTEWFAGTPADLVTVVSPPERLAALLSAAEFVEGERYLVAADDDGTVLVCGFTAPWSQELADLYDQAFRT